MNVFFTTCRLTPLFIVLWLMMLIFAHEARAVERQYVNSTDYFIHYEQTNEKTVAVGLRASEVITTLSAATLRLRNELSNELGSSQSSELIPYPREGDKTAVLFLVDVSEDKTRKKVIKKNQQQIETMIKAGKTHQQFGLATFGEKFTVLSPFGTDKTEIISAVKGVVANENETLLYQYIAEAVDLLGKQEVERRVLIVFSDGKSEDQMTVYNHQSVMEKAKQNDVLIISLAFPPKETTGHHVRDYQTLSNLAMETGGAFIKAIGAGNISKTDLLRVLNATDSGGYLTFDLSPLLLQATSAENVTTDLVLHDENPVVELPLSLHFTKKITGFTSQQQIIAIVAGLLLLFSLLIYLLKKKKIEPVITYAYIYLLDDNERYSITKRTYKIGRNEENDLVLANPTVSSFHAQIHLSRDDEFMITDLQSINGILMNEGDETLTSATLTEGDVITLGEVRLRFVTQNGVN